MLYQGLIAETMALRVGDEEVEAYYSRPLGPGPFPAVVVMHYAAALDEWNRELTRTLAHHGYASIAVNYYSRFGGGSPEDQGARARADGGVADDSVVADTAAALAFLRAQPQASGKVGVIGCCSGGRIAYLVACRLPFDALVDCFGGSVIAVNAGDINEKRPVAPIDYTDQLDCPVLGLFGNEDQNPAMDQVNRTEEILKEKGKTYDFNRYDGAGHGFVIDIRPAYRPEQANDAWAKVFAFYEKTLA